MFAGGHTLAAKVIQERIAPTTELDEVIFIGDHQLVCLLCVTSYPILTSIAVQFSCKQNTILSCLIGQFLIHISGHKETQVQSRV